jgi:hypothetical protein
VEETSSDFAWQGSLSAKLRVALYKADYALAVHSYFYSTESSCFVSSLTAMLSLDWMVLLCEYIKKCSWNERAAII